VGRNVRVKVEGKATVLGNLERQQIAHQGRARAATNAMANRGKELSRRRTPVEDGELRSSYVVSTEMKKYGAKTVLANVAAYAAYVHEQVAEKLRGLPRPGNRKGRYWDGGESKFLEKGTYGNRDDLRRAALNAARISRKKG